MNRITCNHCKQDVDVAMYFFGARITTHDSMFAIGEQYYEAIVNGKAICPLCGKEILEIFHSEIGVNDIIALAGGK